MLQEISDLLRRIGTPGAFATSRTVAADSLKLEVKGVGRIRFPITAATARKLCEAARPARHGYKDRTRLDRRVRDTWEIPKSRILIDEPAWSKTLLSQLDRVRRDLRLPAGCALLASLHNLLVYAPGQFFVTHQDSEKADHMIATLVVGLPSRFTGGAMLIGHHEEKLRVASSGSNLTFTAFYADCHHEVRPIEQGYRVVLTYNLAIEGDTAASASTKQVDALAQSARRFFEEPLPARWDGDAQREPPDRLVYLLDHQYTQRGLAWARLKGADAARAGALREVAKQLDCEIFLALADVHETWSCESDDWDDDYAYRGGWRSRYDAEDEDEQDDDSEDESAGDDATPPLSELIDSAVELRHWVDANGRPEAIAGAVEAREQCWTKPSVELAPFETQHEGYMGNYGNTVDHWYHRAAVVLWPRERTFVIRSKASPRWAIGEVAKMLRSGNAAQARTAARKLLPFWAWVAGREADSRLLEHTLALAARLDDPQITAALLQPFALEQLTTKVAPRFVNCLDRYGLIWCQALLQRWGSEGNRLTEGRLAWISAVLCELFRALRARGSADGLTLAQWIVAQQWAITHAQWKQLHEYAPVKTLAQQIAGLCKPMLSLIEASLIAETADLHAQMLNFLTLDTDAIAPATPLGVAVLQASHADCGRESRRALSLKPVHAHWAKALSARLKRPPRRPDDWSIASSLRCSCKLCATLSRYLRSPSEIRFEWPLAKEHRAHVHQVIDTQDLPVLHATRRSGRPYTLVLEKTTALFERDAEARRTWQADLAWLKQTSADF